MLREVGRREGKGGCSGRMESMGFIFREKVRVGRM
jgi:hypothetical protein